jgi:hypothetical protein
MSDNIKVAIMQPYFLPYIGYWQLINAVDIFVIYDNIQFTKKGWINRNRFLNNGKDELFSLSLKKDSDYLEVVDRFIADSFDKDKIKLLRKIESAYRKAPFFQEGMSILSDCFSYENKNLFEFIFNSVKTVKNKLDIETKMVVSSSLDVEYALKGQDRVIAICQALNATDYINPIGGLELYDKQDFLNVGIQLYFQKVQEVVYPQFNHEFVPYLSIIDVIMFNGVDGAKSFLGCMKLI